MHPRFTHDCETCIFIGQTATHDFYACRGDDIPNITLLARYGDAAEEYSSGWVSIARTVAAQGWQDVTGQHTPGKAECVQQSPLVQSLRYAESYGLERLAMELTKTPRKSPT